ncbi:MAG: peptidase M48 [Gammaproteobacteria bacterium]|nr:peptidase M48 [Gammaproteobacteria bacterium]|tara:strand:+ start:1732 stop:3186 length:1455 start_codon:yes stop_codon:yes gene_type:complete
MRKIRQITSVAASILLLAASTPGLGQSQLPTLGDRISGIYSLEEEYRMGREFLRSVRRSAPTITDPLLNDYLVNFTHNLAVHSDLQDYRLAFVIIDSPALNAFAAPGGIIGVNGGLFLNAHTEGEFASVIAHELAHVSQRHFARSVEDAQRRRIPELATLLASVVLMGTGSSAGPAAVMAAQGRSIENQLRFSRQNEAEADRLGLRTLYNAGYAPDDMARLFERLVAMTRFSSRPPEFLLSHPVTESRVSDARSRANQYPARVAPPDLEYQLMRARVQVHYEPNKANAVKDFSQRLQDNIDSNNTDGLRYGLAMAYFENQQHDRALELIEQLLAKEPNRITYVVSKAEILVDSGDPRTALPFIDHHLRINPANHPLTMARASALIGLRDYAEAVKVLEAHAQRRPDDHNLWYMIAETQGQAGDISKVHQARAEYFILVGDFRSAREQLHYALRIENDREENIPLISRLRQRINDVETLQREQQS